MRVFTYLSVLTVSISLTLGAVAQSVDTCDNVLIYAGRDTTSSTYDSTIAKSLYQNECSGSSAKRSSSTSVGLEAVVKAIPVKFNFGGSSNEERLANFCKGAQEYYSSALHSQEDQSSVVREALSSWNECIKAKDVQFMPKILDEQVFIGVRHKTSVPVTVMGVFFDEKTLNCTVPSKEGTQVPANRDTWHLLTEDDFTIACRRLPMPNGEGASFYESSLGVVTNHDNFTLRIPPGARQPHQWSQHFEDEINTQKLDLDRLSNSIRLDCAHTSIDSDNRTFPVADVHIPAELPHRSDYRVTGGGCSVAGQETNLHGPPVYNHDPAIIMSYQYQDDGWRCVGGDPPDKPVSFVIRASVTYCRVKVGN